VVVTALNTKPDAPDVLEKVGFEFRVKKSWLTEHKIDNSDYVYCSAISQGFSYFVIAGEKGTLVEVQTPTTPTPTTPPLIPAPTPPPKPIKVIVRGIEKEA